MRAFRVALYSSGIQPWDLLHSVESPRPSDKISQAMDFFTCSTIVHQMRVLHGHSVGMLADSQKLVEFYSQPQVAFTVVPQCSYLQTPAAKASTESHFLKKLATPMSKQVAEALQDLPPLKPSAPAVAQAMPCGLSGEVTVTVCDPAPLTPPAPVKLSGEKLPWWERLVLWLLGKPVEALNQLQEYCCGK